jgi:hypothetical protein
MIILDYMMRPKVQTHITEHYVSSPPALTIFDERGDVFTLANEEERPDAPRGEFAFMVLVNGRPTGTIASRIERRNGRIRAFTRSGWVRWTGFTFI